MMILEKVEIVSEAAPAWVYVLLAVGFIGILTLWTFLLSRKKVRPERCSSCMVITALGFMFLMTILGDFAVSKEPTGRYQYKVALTEELRLKEVYDKYTIIEVGESYIILEEKELVDCE